MCPLHFDFGVARPFTPAKSGSFSARIEAGEIRLRRGKRLSPTHECSVFERTRLSSRSCAAVKAEPQVPHLQLVNALVTGLGPLFVLCGWLRIARTSSPPQSEHRRFCITPIKRSISPLIWHRYPPNNWSILTVLGHSLSRLRKKSISRGGAQRLPLRYLFPQGVERCVRFFEISLLAGARQTHNPNLSQPVLFTNVSYLAQTRSSQPVILC